MLMIEYIKITMHIYFFNIFKINKLKYNTLPDISELCII